MLTEISGLKSPTEDATLMCAAHQVSIQATYRVDAAVGLAMIRGDVVADTRQPGL